MNFIIDFLQCIDYTNIKKSYMQEADVMCNKTTLDLLLKETGTELNKIFGSNLDRIILYGSYARGDYDDESDIDIMALVDMDKFGICKYRRTVSSLANDIDLKYDVLLSIKLQDKPTFVKYQDVLPFYKNVLKEGVLVNV